MAIEIPYNAHFDLSPTGHVALARSCGDGWWEEWVCIDQEWRCLAELLLDGPPLGSEISETLNARLNLVLHAILFVDLLLQYQPFLHVCYRQGSRVSHQCLALNADNLS